MGESKGKVIPAILFFSSVYLIGTYIGYQRGKEGKDFSESCVDDIWCIAITCTLLK